MDRVLAVSLAAAFRRIPPRRLRRARSFCDPIRIDMVPRDLRVVLDFLFSNTKFDLNGTNIVNHSPHYVEDSDRV